jgi:hypothetical protein
MSLALAACNGTAVVTLTSTASQDNYLAYRVGLAAVELEASGGKSGLKILPASTTMDLATLTDVSEVLGAAAVAKGKYTSAIITLDFSSAQIIYDDGSLNGVTLSPVGANGQPMTRVQLTVSLDPSDAFSVTSRQTSQLAMNFNLAASNVVNLTNKTVTVTPLMAASAQPIDAKQVRIRGPLASLTGAASTTATTASFSMGVMPFNGTVTASGKLTIVTATDTTFEINGTPSTGSAGMTQLESAGTGTLAVAYGSLTVADSTTTTTVNGATTSSSSSDVSFTATQVFAGSSVQGGGFDRVTGVVSARSGNTVTIEDGTLVGSDGVEAFVGGTTTLNLGTGTAVTVFGQGAAENNTTLQVSVGSAIDAFGVATSLSSGNLSLDASAGRVRLDNTTASGLVTVQGSDSLNLNLVSLGGRAVGAFDFVGSGATAGQYVVSTGALDLTNSTVGAPVIVTGVTGSFGVATPNFAASALLDPTTIQAELVIDWGTGTAAPFTTYDSSAIDVDASNSSIGARHAIQIGAQTINIVGLSSDPLIVPNSTGTNAVFAIGHAVSATVETFNSYAAFVTQLQTELNGTTLATGMTAIGQYTASTFSFTATSVTLFLNN